MSSSFTQVENRYKDASSPGNIEPMSLGSPVSSPKNKANQNFLPPYLFGDNTPSPVAATWNTPQKTNLSIFQSPLLSTPVSHLREQQIPYRSPTSSLINSTPAKSGGPPIQGLLYSDTNQTTVFNNSQIEGQGTPNVTERLISNGNNFNNVMTPNRSMYSANTSILSPAQIDPFFTQGEALKHSNQLDECWVTVFGFPAASSSYIVQQFAQYGTIVEQKISPNGNWMHLRYQSKLQAKKALSKNGKVLSGNIMIGVKPCIEMDLMESYKENSLLDSSELTRQDSFRSDTTEPSRPNLKNIRHLTQAYQSPVTQAQETKSGGIVSKAFEYLWKLH